MTSRATLCAALALAAAALARPARAHITPPVVLASDREAVSRLLAGASRYFVREIRLSPEQRNAIRRRTGWNPDDERYRFYVGRTAEGAQVGSTLFTSEFTIHGPVRVAVALAPDGKVKGASVVEVTEESYTWVKPLLESGFLQRFAGRDGQDALAQAADVGGSMPRFYAEVIARLIGRAAALYDVARSKP
jgi:hypothetical protein